MFIDERGSWRIKFDLLREECADLDVRVASHRLNDSVDVALRRVAGVDLREAGERARLGRVEVQELVFATENEEVAEGVAALVRQN